MNLLKTKRVQFSFGELEIRQLPAIAQMEMLEARERPGVRSRYEGLLVVCRYGAWPDQTVDDLANSISLEIANEVSEAVLRFSGFLDEKNSATVQGDDSSSG